MHHWVLMGVFESNSAPMLGIPADTEALRGYAVAFSGGIRKIRYINRFLGVRGVVSPWQALARRLPVKFVLVWGRKQNSRKALQYASVNKLPVRYIEDGWIRSCSSDAHSRLSYSVLLDDQGVYYDSSVPSALETCLNLSDDDFDKLCTARDLEYARRCRRILVDSDITKYNFVAKPSIDDLQAADRPLVLVLDQTRDDASVTFGAMNAELFEKMLYRAVEENPDSRVVVRTHPDVVAGRRRGYLQDAAIALGVEISAAGDNPLPWLKAASLVYVGTSQLGYEALLCGCKVKVSGQPFYAGWGLTDDQQAIRRRTRVRTIDQLFYATHVKHAHYCCPVTGQRWQLDECLAHVKLQQEYFKRNAGARVAIGITPWKRKYLAQFLRTPNGRLRFSDTDDVRDGEVAVRWSYSDRNLPSAKHANQSRELNRCTVAGISDSCIRVEDGFIRSRGLGSDFSAPASLVMDPVGLYFDAGTSSFLENMLNVYQCSEAELERADALHQRLLAANLTKYNVGTLACTTSESEQAASRRQSILVIGQVEGDQSLLRGTGDVASNSELLEAVRANNPDARIIYKPHPDVVSGNRPGEVEPDVIARCANHIETTRHLLDCLEECDELHTMTSLSGFEALMRGKRVVTYGLPFYAGWGLTQDHMTCNRRITPRDMNELVYLCLVRYPHYVDLESGEFMSVEQLVEKLSADGATQQNISGVRWIRKLSNIFGSLVYRA